MPGGLEAEIRGTSPQITALRDQIRRLLTRQAGARRLPSVLILGETGTGKTLLARTMHHASGRGDRPFVAVNCAAIPETLLESELFGHERGAFTDARSAKTGLMQLADGGTLFLDEVGAMPLALQSKLLTAVEDRSIRPLGSTRTTAVDIWIVAATSEDLPGAAGLRRFREDLYHRLSTISLRMPALRERSADIVELAQYFLSRSCEEHALAPKHLSTDARAALLAHSWPGNVRELANVMERVTLLSDAVAVSVEDLGLSTPARSTTHAQAATSAEPLEPVSFRESLGDLERVQLVSALTTAQGNLSKAAALLGIPRNTLRYRLEKYGVRSPTAAVGTAAPAVAPVTEPELPDTTQGTGFLWLRVKPGQASQSSTDVLEAVRLILDRVTWFGGSAELLDTVTVLGRFSGADIPQPVRRALNVFVAVQQAVRLGGTNASLTGVIHFARTDTGALGEIERLVEDATGHGLVITAEAAPFLDRELVPAGAVDAPATGPAKRPPVARRLASAPRRPSIAVLPFRNLSGNEVDHYFGEGITEDIVGGLSRLRWLFVIARFSTLGYQDAAAAPGEIAARLGVRYLVEGTVRRSGDRLRVTAGLIDSQTEQTVWSNHFDGAFADLFAFQDQITSSVVAALDTRVRLHETGLAIQRPQRLDSYDCVLRALHYFYKSSYEDFHRAGELLEEALGYEPASVFALAWRAWWLNRLIGQGWSKDPRGDTARALQCAESALEGDRDDPFALAVAAHLAAFLSRNFETAMGRFARSLEINPNSAFAWGMSAATLCYVGEPHTALERVKYALRLSPFDPQLFSFLGLAGFAEMLLGNYESAIDWAQRARRENPSFSANLRVLTASLALLERDEEARAVAAEFLSIEREFRLSDFARRYPLASDAGLERYVAALRRAGLPE